VRPKALEPAPVRFAAIPPFGGEYILVDGKSLGDDEFFFIGDNVEASKDSRFDGPSHRGAILGVVDALYWPLGRSRIFRQAPRVLASRVARMEHRSTQDLD
jgi:hypothetical protein